MKYRELQKEAKKLGLKSVGLSKKDLLESIKSAKSQGEEKPKLKRVKFNAAIVFNGINKVRTYTQDIHGEKFAELADEFSQAHSYKVELVELKPGIVCPSCGHTFHN